MSSVFVQWSGRCSDRAARSELIEMLQRVADRSAARVEGPAVPRPAFLEIMTAARGETAEPLPAVRTFDETIRGQLLLDPSLAPNPQQLLEEVRQQQWPILEVGPGGADKTEPYCLKLDESPRSWLLPLNELQVRGLDFELYDPRKLYPHSNRMSFVFATCPELPAIDGAVVQLESQAQCRAYNSEQLRNVDWYVSCPNIHLRYCLEEWTDMLLGWVKCFFVRELHFSRYEDLPGYEALSQMLASYPADESKLWLLDYLLERFERESDDWEQQLGQMI
mgnify:CR=1 FL=1